MSARFAIPYGYSEAQRTFPCYIDDRHLVTVGSTRSGKGSTVIVQALAQAPHSMLVNDPKGQNAAVTWRQRVAMGQEVFFLNPFGMHLGPPWNLRRDRYNPLAHLDIKSANFVAKVRGISQALIVTQGREPYFDDTARDLVSAVIAHLVATLGPRATLAHMRKHITDIAARGKEAAALLVAMGNSPYPFVSQPIGRFKDAEARDISSAINSAITQTAFLDDPAFSHRDHGTLTASGFSLMQLKKKPTTVYLILPGGEMESYARFLRLMIISALDQLTSEPGGYPVLFLIDEFLQLENLPAVSAAFTFAAGFNVQLWPFIQDLPTLQSIYGKKGTSFFANSGMVQFFTPTEIETAEYLQRRGGMTTGESLSRTYAGSFLKLERSESRSESRVPLLPFEHMMSLPSSQSVVFFAGKHDPLIAGRKPYWEIPRLAGKYAPDPYHP